MAELKTETCPECQTPVIVIMAEDDRIIRLDITAQRRWRTIEVSPSHKVAVAVDVHDSHVATCKGINRTE